MQITQRFVKPKSEGQRKYFESIDKNTITFGIGPAGTGKTLLAIARAVQYLLEKKVDRIVLTRPAVEAGEKLGFLPGDMQSKIDPYLRPLYDSLNMMLEIKSVNKLIEDGVIEVAPLAFMRGRTLSSSFVILDEAQNTTVEQMKMFLTRLGEGSKMVVTGDLTQIDLIKPSTSGLINATKILNKIDDLEICKLGIKDQVRHTLVTKILTAYDKE